MKFLSFLFAIHFFVLAVTPCADGGHCAEVNGNAITYIHQGDCGNAQHADEMCSPLCLCQCCGAVTLLTESLIQTHISDFTVYHYSYSEGQITSVPSSIWQPPKA